MKPIVWIVFLVLVATSFFYYLNRNNFHTLLPGEVYRSAQLSPDDLEQYILDHGIRTILNLRGANLNEEWYQAEKKVSTRMNVFHHDIALKATQLPTIYEVRELFAFLEIVQKPFLIHCKAGADRTGLVSALILLSEGKQNLSQIQDQVSWRYFAIEDKSAGKQFIEQYRYWLETNQFHHKKSLFKKWVENDYIDANGNMRFSIDTINGEILHLGNDEIFLYDLDRSKETNLIVNGWAFDQDNETLISHIEIILNQSPFKKNKYGISRPDVGKFFHNDSLINSGWRAEQDIHLIPNGCYDILLRIYKLDGNSWTSPPKARACITG